MTRALLVAPGHTAHVEDGRVRVSSAQPHSALRAPLEAQLQLAGPAGARSVRLGGRTLASVDDGSISAPLTAFEARYFADTHAPLPSSTDAPLPFHPCTDLHTHFAAALPGTTLVELARDHDLALDDAQWREVGVETGGAKGGPRLTRVADVDERAHRRLAAALDLPVDQQSFFLEMERRYRLRAPITKAPALFRAQLFAIGRALALSGVRYAELSLSESLKPEVLAALHEHLDDVERETGARLRFLIAFRRVDDPEWDLDILARYQDCLQSRAVVGIDIMGHETCATERVRPVLEAAGALARIRAGLVVRIHAGENPAYPQNIRQALDILEPYPDVELRIGHGLYGQSDALMARMAREPERVIVELNLTSNLALNNIQGARQVPIARLLDAGVSVVLGTDGAGLYGTNARDEVRAALACGAAPTQLSRIAAVERALLERKQAREDALPALRAFEPPPERAPIHFTQETLERGARQRALAARALAERIAALGAHVSQERPALGGRPILWLAGAWKHAITELTVEQRARVTALLDALMRGLAARGAVVLTGGTVHGVEGIAHEAAARHGVELVGVFPDDMPPHDLDGRVRTFWRCAPSLWAKAEPLVTFVRDMDGFALFVGGGLVVADEEQAASNLGVRHAVVRGLPGAAAQALHASRRTRFVDDAAEVLAAFDARIPRGALWRAGANDAVDVVALRAGARGETEVLVIVRHDASDAAAGWHALPGGFVRDGESHRDAALRVLASEGGVDATGAVLTRVTTVEGPGRDPRDTRERWVRTTLFLARVDHDGPLVAGAGAARARFVPLDERPALAFDHDALIARAIAHADASPDLGSDPRDSTG